MNKKIMIFVTAMVLVFAMVTGATLAYVTSFADPVKNTFVTGDFGVVTLSESGDDGGADHKYTIIPGCDINKRPKFSFEFSDDAIVTGALVFVTMDTASAWSTSDKKTFNGTINDVTNALSFSVNMDNWDGVFENDGVYVYYKLLNGHTTDIALSDFFTVEDDNTITVSGSLDEDDCKSIMNNMSNYEITFKAYAIQKDGFVAETETTPTEDQAKEAYDAVIAAAADA